MPQSKINLRLRKRTLGRTDDAVIANKRQTRSSLESTKDKLLQSSAFGDPSLEETKNTIKRNADTVNLKDSNKEVKKKKTIKQTVLSQLVKRKSPSTKSVTTKNSEPICNNNKSPQEEEVKEEEKEEKEEEADKPQEDNSSTHIENNSNYSNNNNNDLTDKAISKGISVLSETEKIISTDTTTTTTKTVDVSTDIKEKIIKENEPLSTPVSEKEEEEEESNDSENNTVHIDANNNHIPIVNDKYSSFSSLSPVSDISSNIINNDNNKDRENTEIISKDVLTPPPSLDTTPISTRFIDKSQENLPLPSDTSLLSKLEKERIADERSTLDKLVKALDISLTFHSARNVAAFFHKIQPMLRNSTRKNITLSHVCKILFLAPELYDVHTKLLKEFGKEIEAHQISFGPNWVIPLSGKSIEERKNLISDRSGKYFEEHKEPNATIPEKSLPKLDKIVDQKNWLEKAKLPERVRSILELQEKRKAAKEELKAKPKATPTGTAKERAKALLERIRSKQK